MAWWSATLTTRPPLHSSIKVDLKMTTPLVSVNLPLLHWKLLLQLLDDLSDVYGNAGSNDFSIPITPDNAQEVAELARAIEASTTGGEVDEEWLARRLSRAQEIGQLHTLNFGVLGAIVDELRSGTGLVKSKR